MRTRLLVLATVIALASCTYRFSVNVPYQTTPFSSIKLDCNLKNPGPCEAIVSAFGTYQVQIEKRSDYIAKVDARYGKSQTGYVIGVGGGAGGYKAVEGLTGLGISIYRGTEFVARSALDVSEGTLAPDEAARKIVKALTK